ncbi:hypothetical protein QFC21_003219 [Naganishia friedmannii]|uniref:Uncharacterized protein n=1 Tax=Naganishia friedmannii TaxID=89922 RepID=A0ACC2VSE5_9TREE|nr:hypothetical protein QFC21_003219 [Naganishia friedmannii]
MSLTGGEQTVAGSWQTSFDPPSIQRGNESRDSAGDPQERTFKLSTQAEASELGGSVTGSSMKGSDLTAQQSRYEQLAKRAEVLHGQGDDNRGPAPADPGHAKGDTQTADQSGLKEEDHLAKPSPSGPKLIPERIEWDDNGVRIEKPTPVADNDKTWGTPKAVTPGSMSRGPVGLDIVGHRSNRRKWLEKRVPPVAPGDSGEKGDSDVSPNPHHPYTNGSQSMMEKRKKHYQEQSQPSSSSPDSPTVDKDPLGWVTFGKFREDENGWTDVSQFFGETDTEEDDV